MPTVADEGRSSARARAVGTAHLPKPLRRHGVARAMLRLGLLPRFTILTFNGQARLIADLRDAEARDAFLSGFHYQQYASIGGFFLQPGAVYFDVGANFGFLTFGLTSELSLQSIDAHLFEPVRTCVDCLELSIELHGLADKIVLNRCCVTDRAGQSNLRVDTEHISNSYISDEAGETVPNLRLDDYFALRGLTQVDLLKIDVEGHEPRVLAGAGSLLADGKISVIFTEVSTSTLSRSGYTPAAYLDLMRGYGYHLFFCRNEDLGGVTGLGRRLILSRRDRELHVAELKSIPADCHTDVLAVHERMWDQLERRPL